MSTLSNNDMNYGNRLPQEDAPNMSGGEHLSIPSQFSSALSEHNQRLLEATKLKIREHLDAHAKRETCAFRDYHLNAFEEAVTQRLSAVINESSRRLEIQFNYIEREKFGGDVAIHIPELLRQGGPKVFIQNQLPKILAALQESGFANTIEKVEARGMYVNVKFKDSWLLSAIQDASRLANAFGTNEALAGRTFVVDYSSPNVAKALHAGHIRSTIIGHVLSNLLENSGAVVFRLNHINDFGGFGFILEGYRRFANYFPPEMTDPQRLVELYRIRRTFEKIASTDIPLEQLDNDALIVLRQYMPEVQERDSFIRGFKEYVSASDKRFAALEAGDPIEVELWTKMVQWSLSDFEPFYRALNIHIDFTLGESFYFEPATALLNDAVSAGTVKRFTAELVEKEKQRINDLFTDGKFGTSERDALLASAEKDLGALVIEVGEGQRLVVQRSDGRSIYATRDLGAIKVRSELFHPTDIIYVVGQEQKLHFSQLFEAACKLGIAPTGSLNLEHKYFGFYVDAVTRKKLSSRDMVAGVNSLLEASYRYFKQRVAEKSTMEPEKLEDSARQLAVGSVVFNDLKQDVKGAVDFDLASIESIVENFEKAGGAYVVYTACRARSISRKVESEHLEPTSDCRFEPSSAEARLMLETLRLPKVASAAAQQTNPSLLVQYLLELSKQFNSYYTRVRVIDSQNRVDPNRLAVVRAVQRCLENGLRLCHVECPEKI